jgi:hypothetical protein
VKNLPNPPKIFQNVLKHKTKENNNITNLTKIRRLKNLEVLPENPSVGSSILP